MVSSICAGQAARMCDFDTVDVRMQQIP